MALRAAEVHELTLAVRGLSVGIDHFRRVLAKSVGLSNTAILAMGHLFVRGGMMPKDLGAELELTTGSVTAVVDRLCDCGYAERVPNPSDRRSSIVQLTDDGRSVIAEGYRTAEAAIGAVMRQLAKQGLFDTIEPAELTRVLTELGQRLAVAE